MENEKEAICNKNIHMGHNVMKFRQLKNLKQGEFAQMIGLGNQQAVSRLENRPVIGIEMLQKISPVLGVSIEVLKSMSEDNSTVIFENNTFEGGSTANIMPNSTNENFSNTYEPIDKVLNFFKEFVEEERKQKAELMDQIKNLEELIRKRMK